MKKLIAAALVCTTVFFLSCNSTDRDSGLPNLRFADAIVKPAACATPLAKAHPAHHQTRTVEDKRMRSDRSNGARAGAKVGRFAAAICGSDLRDMRRVIGPATTYDAL